MEKTLPGCVIPLLCVLCISAACSAISCGSRGNATARQKDELRAAIVDYWENQKDYSLGYTNAVGKISYAEINGDTANVDAEIIVGYTRPTEGAGYKTVSFRLLREGDAWKVTYDGWIDEVVDPDQSSES